MIQNEDAFMKWENHWVAGDHLSLEKKFRILDGMYREARTLGVFPPKDPFEGLDQKIKFAKALNVRKAT